MFSGLASGDVMGRVRYMPPSMAISLSLRFCPYLVRAAEGKRC